jgi:hypothetical protein
MPNIKERIPFQCFKNRLSNIDSSIELFSEQIGIALITAKKWNQTGVPYKYQLILEYFELLFCTNNKYKNYTLTIEKKEKKHKKKD